MKSPSHESHAPEIHLGRAWRGLAHKPWLGMMFTIHNNGDWGMVHYWFYNFFDDEMATWSVDWTTFFDEELVIHSFLLTEQRFQVVKPTSDNPNVLGGNKFPILGSPFTPFPWSKPVIVCSYPGVSSNMGKSEDVSPEDHQWDFFGILPRMTILPRVVICSGKKNWQKGNKITSWIRLNQALKPVPSWKNHLNWHWKIGKIGISMDIPLVNSSIAIDGPCKFTFNRISYSKNAGDFSLSCGCRSSLGGLCLKCQLAAVLFS